MGFKYMEAFSIKISQEQETVNYHVVDKQTDDCEFEGYLDEALVAVFEPYEDEYIHICRNPGGLDEEVIVQIAGRIEQHYL